NRQVENATQRHRAPNHPRREVVGLQIFLIQGEQRDEVAARRMAAQIKAVRIAAILTDVASDPGPCRGNVLDLRRVRMFRRQAVARNDREDARLREAIAHWRILEAIAAFPRAAVNENEHRRWPLTFWQVQIEDRK